MVGIQGIYSKNQLLNEKDQMIAILEQEQLQITQKTFGSHHTFFCVGAKNTAHIDSLITSGDIILLCCGELFDAPDSLSEILIESYQQGDYSRLNTINGSFAAVIYHKKTNELILLSDRNGSIKLFYHYNTHKIVFSPRLFPLLPFLENKTINTSALADFLLFGYPLEHQTLLKEIQILPPGHVLQYTDKGISITKYIKDVFKKTDDISTEGEVQHTLHQLFQQAIKKRTNFDQKKLILFSGGLDSRAILAFCLDLFPSDQIMTVSFGDEKSYDYTIPHMIAHSLGLNHKLITVENKGFEQQYRNNLHTSDAMIDATPYFPMKGYQNLTDDQMIVLSGFLGGEVMGPLIFPKIKNHINDLAVDINLRKELLFDHHRIHDKSLIQDILNPQIFSDEDLMRSFHESTKNIMDVSKDEFYDYCASWMYRNESFKNTSYCNLRFPDAFEYQTPFLDTSLMDFIFTLPPEYRTDKQLYKSMLLHVYPDVFAFPTKNTFGVSLTASSLRLLLRRIRLGTLTRINKITTLVFKKNWFIDPLENYIDYNDLIRINEEYRRFLKTYLDLVKRREFFCSDMIDRLWDDHLKGKNNHAVLFGLLVTFELFMETYMEQTPYRLQEGITIPQEQ